MAAVLTALVLVAIGGLLVRALSVPAAAPAHTLTWQAGASGYGSAWNYSTLRSGTQSVEGPAPAASPSAKFHEPGSRRGGAQI